VHELFVDCHWRFTPAAAARTIDALAALRVVWFECPIPERSETIGAIRTLRAHANAHGMRLAGLEELTSAEAFHPWLSAGAYDVVMPDVKYCGGIASLIAIDAEASRHGIACAPHNPTGPVCHAASLAACSAIAPPVLLELQWDETPAFYAMGPGLPRASGGSSALPDRPGLGVGLDLSKLPA
jgi:galactonate dehydratase